jgi:hypothetical protein
VHRVWAAVVARAGFRGGSITNAPNRPRPTSFAARAGAAPAIPPRPADDADEREHGEDAERGGDPEGQGDHAWTVLVTIPVR